MPSHPIPLHRAGGKEWNKIRSPPNIYLDGLIFLKLLSNLSKMERVKETLALFFRA